jgi:limonene-1,2-epoxide hydrolase
VSTRAAVTSFWAAMQDNDWVRAAGHLAEDCPVDWPCSGERMVGRRAFAEMQARYPSTTKQWTFDIIRLVVEGDTAVSEVTASDGQQAARVIAFSTVSGGLIVRQVEYWPIAYDPPAGRADLVQPISPIP